jgi:hypothetical protein
MDFRAALLQLENENMFPKCARKIEDELKDRVPRNCYMKDNVYPYSQF